MLIRSNDRRSQIILLLSILSSDTSPSSSNVPQSEGLGGHVKSANCDCRERKLDFSNDGWSSESVMVSSQPVPFWKTQKELSRPAPGL
jgi:hypothetical protein